MYRHQIQFEKLYIHNKDFSQGRNDFIETIEGKGDQNMIARSGELLKRFQGKERELNDIYRLNKNARGLIPLSIEENKGDTTQQKEPIKFGSPKEKAGQPSYGDLLAKLEHLAEKVGDISEKLKTQKKKDEKPGHQKNDKASVINLQQISKCRNTTIIFLVTSHSSNKARRAAIRNNWGYSEIFRIFKDKYGLDYQVYFSVGLADNHEASVDIKKEAESYRDILIIDRNEDFYDLTRRVMAGFEWAVQQCTFQYLFKMDDDIFINIPNVMKLLTNGTISKNKNTLYAGDMNIQAPVNRNPKSKYSVTYKEWPTEIYPPYCSGGGFIISRDIIKQIIPHFDWEDPFKIDDVYVGILIQRARIENMYFYVPEDDDMFWFYSNTSVCEYRTKSLVYHKVGNNTCMRQLTTKAYADIPKITYEIEKMAKTPLTVDDLIKSVQIPRGFARTLAIKRPVRGKLPKLSELKKAKSPLDLKKKQRDEYMDILKQRLHTKV